MRIAVVVHRSPTYSETFLASLARAWQSLGHELIWCVGWEGALPRPGYQPALPLRLHSAKALRYIAHTIARGWWWHPGVKALYRAERSAGATPLRALKRVYFNLHILQLSVDGLYFGFASAALQRECVAQVLGVPAWASVRGADIALLPLQQQQPYVRLWPRLARLHVLSQDLLTLARQQGLPHTLPVQRIAPVVPEPLPTPRQPRHMTKGPLHLLWVGRLTWKKNPGLALTLVHQLQQQGVAVHLTLVGEGEERPALDVQAEALGITKWLTWTGVCDHAQVWAHMARADVLLHTAWQEGFGNVLLEAQAVGLWAVAAPAEGVGENLVPGETGMIMPDWQPHHWTQAILAYRQQSPEAQAQHARQSRQRIQTHFGWDKHLQQWQEFLMC